MGNAGGVFQADEVCVFSIARSLYYLRKLVRGSIVETAVGPDFVVLLSPVSDLYSCIEEVAEPTRPQALFAQLTVEALHMTVLHWPAGLDVAQLNLPLQGLGKKVTAG